MTWHAPGNRSHDLTDQVRGLVKAAISEKSAVTVEFLASIVRVMA